MKKALSLILALAMVAALSIVTFAAAPTEKAASGIDYITILPPDADGICKIQFVFTADVDMAGYEAKWGIGYFKADGSFTYWNPDSDASPTSWGDFRWFKNEAGRTVFENIMHPKAEQLNDEGETYANLYEKAKAGKIYGFLADYNAANHPVDGKTNCDAQYEFPCNAIVDDLDANMACAGVAGLEEIIVNAPDETGYCKLQFVFTAGVDMGGYEAKWGIGYYKADGSFTYWNPDSDCIPNGEMHWGNFSWYKMADGRLVFENYMEPTAEQLNDEGESYANMYEKAKAGKLVGFLADYNGNSHPVNGKTDCDAQYAFNANAIVDGLDANMAPAVAAAATETPDAPATGDAMIASLAIVAIASMGVALTISKKH